MKPPRQHQQLSIKGDQLKLIGPTEALRDITRKG